MTSLEVAQVAFVIDGYSEGRVWVREQSCDASSEAEHERERFPRRGSRGASIRLVERARASSEVHAGVRQRDSKATLQVRTRALVRRRSPSGSRGPAAFRRRTRRVHDERKEPVTRLSKRTKGMRGCQIASPRRGSSDIEHREGCVS